MKPTLLYVSPFWPQKSGISEYSETLIWGLKEYFDVTIVTKKKVIENKRIKDSFEIYTYKENEDYSKYDYIIYNFGNSPDNHDYMYDMLAKFPGYVILHDFSLYYLTVLRYREKNMLFQKIYELEGAEGIAYAKDSIKETGELDLIQHKHLPPFLPLNKEVLVSAKGVIVHSNYTKEKVLEIDSTISTCKIELVDCMPNIKLSTEDFLRTKYNLSADDCIIGAVGMIAPSKQNEITCKAINSYNETHSKKIKYIMIGEGEYVDSYLNKNIIKTVFVNNEDFFNAINSCNVIFNLRNPYNGESSATLMQCLLMGKHCVVTDQGWFSELPDECVNKVSKDIDEKGLVNLLEDAMDWTKFNEKGNMFVEKKCNCKTVAKSIAAYLKI